MPLLTQKEYAARIRKTPQYVNKRVKDGTIKLVGRKVDTRQADLALKQTQQRVVARRTAADRPRSQKRWQRKASAVKSKTVRTQKPTVHAAQPKPPRGTLTEARTLREQLQAEVVRLDLEQRKGNLLPKAEVLEAERQKNATLKAALRRLPRSLAPTLARMGDPAEVETVLLAEIDLVLERLAADPLGATDAPIAPPPPSLPEAPASSQEAAA